MRSVSSVFAPHVRELKANIEEIGSLYFAFPYPGAPRSQDRALIPPSVVPIAKKVQRAASLVHDVVHSYRLVVRDTRQLSKTLGLIATDHQDTPDFPLTDAHVARYIDAFFEAGRHLREIYRLMREHGVTVPKKSQDIWTRFGQSLLGGGNDQAIANLRRDHQLFIEAMKSAPDKNAVEFMKVTDTIYSLSSKQSQKLHWLFLLDNLFKDGRSKAAVLDTSISALKIAIQGAGIETD